MEVSFIVVIHFEKVFKVFFVLENAYIFHQNVSTFEVFVFVSRKGFETLCSKKVVILRRICFLLY